MTIVIEARHPPAGRFVRSFEIGKIHLVDKGPRDPIATVVLLHGATAGLGDMMATLGERLSERYRVVAIDRPGHGWSNRPHGPWDGEVWVQAEFIHQAIKAVGVDRAIVVGHSFGGAIATKLALDHPEDVASLVLLAPITHGFSGGMSWYYRPATDPIINYVYTHTVGMPLGLALFDRTVETYFKPQSPPANYAEASGAKLVLRPGQFRANAEDLRGLRFALKLQAPHYGRIDVPTVIIAGDRDSFVPWQVHSAALARDIKDARLVILPGVGHMPHWVEPDRVLGEIERMAEQLKAMQLAR